MLIAFSLKQRCFHVQPYRAASLSVVSCYLAGGVNQLFSKSCFNLFMLQGASFHPDLKRRDEHMQTDPALSLCQWDEQSDNSSLMKNSYLNLFVS